MRTSGQFLQDSPVADGQIFLGPFTGLALVGGNTTNNINQNNGANANFFNLNGASTTYNIVANLTNILRTGTAPNYQEQFGTAALQPGPSSVANTSDPLNLTGMPPIKKAVLATLTGGSNGFIAKGMQINWIDLIYATGANAVTSVFASLDAIKFANNVAPVVTNLFNNYGGASFPTAAQTNPYVARATITNPSFLVTTDSTFQVNIQVITGATATTSFYGIVLGVSFNFN